MSETEYSETSSNSSEGTEEYSDSDNQDIIEVEGNILAYQDEPLADEEDMDDREDGGMDTDGLTPAVLAARYHGETPLNEWNV